MGHNADEEDHEASEKFDSNTVQSTLNRDIAKMDSAHGTASVVKPIPLTRVPDQDETESELRRSNHFRREPVTLGRSNFAVSNLHSALISEDVSLTFQEALEGPESIF